MMLAKSITDYAVVNFINKKSGLFYFSQTQVLSSISRKTDINDNYIPSSNAVMAKVLYSLGTVFDDTSYTNRSLGMLSAAGKMVSEFPSYNIQWSIFAGLICSKSYQIVIVGKDALTKKRELEQAYLPTSIFMGSNNEESFPLLKGKFKENKTLVYVCTDRLCKKSVEESSKALEQLK